MNPLGRPESEVVSKYWDENREKSLDQTFWMAHPLCRQRINQRISGSPHEWPLDWFKRVYCEKPFRRGISWGSGLGAFERAAIRCGAVLEIDAFDISSSSLSDARRTAEEDSIVGINYRLGDFNNPVIDQNRYDIAFFQESLHHVSALERLFRRLALSLKPGAFLYAEEFVGPSRTQWRPEYLRLAQSLLDEVPEQARTQSKLEFPIEVNDPSEAVRSGEIPAFLRAFFEILEWRSFGGQIVDLVIPCLRWDWAMSPEGSAYVQRLLDVEDLELQRDPSTSHHLVAVGRLKPLGALTGPLAGQCLSAVGRRLSRLLGR